MASGERVAFPGLGIMGRPMAANRVVAAGSGASRMLDPKAEPMLAGDYEPLFRLEHMLKDARQHLAEAGRDGAPTRLATEAERLHAKADRDGHGRDDFAAVTEAARPTRA